MKTMSLILLLLLISKFSLTQPVFVVSYGECYKVLESLKENLKNDSLVVDYFVENYKINGKRVVITKQTSPSKFIQYYQKEENKHIMCTHRKFEHRKVLLDTSNISKLPNP